MTLLETHECQVITLYTLNFIVFYVNYTSIKWAKKKKTGMGMQEKTAQTVSWSWNKGGEWMNLILLLKLKAFCRSLKLN